MANISSGVASHIDDGINNFLCIKHTIHEGVAEGELT